MENKAPKARAAWHDRLVRVCVVVAIVGLLGYMFINSVLQSGWEGTVVEIGGSGITVVTDGEDGQQFYTYVPGQTDRTIGDQVRVLELGPLKIVTSANK